MAKKLTEKALIKNMNTMSREELIKIISDLFKTNKSVEARLNLMPWEMLITMQFL